MPDFPPNPEDGERFLPADLFLEINASSGAPITFNIKKISSSPRRVSSSNSVPPHPPLPLAIPVSNFKVHDTLLGAKPNVKPTIGNGLPTIDYCFYCPYCPQLTSGYPFVSGPRLPCYSMTPTLQNQGFKSNGCMTRNPQGTGVYLPAGSVKPLRKKESRPNKGGKKDTIEIYGKKHNVMEEGNKEKMEELGRTPDQK